MANIEWTETGTIQQGLTGAIEITVYSDGTPTDPSVASLTVIDGQGNTVATGGASIIGSGSGRVAATLDDAVTGEAKTLTATWTLTVGGNSQTFTTYHEVRGDLLFSESELRAFDGGAVANQTTYTDTAILAMRSMVDEAFEQIVTTAFGARFRREVLDGDGTETLWLGQTQVLRILGAAIRETGSTTWTALAGSELADLLLSSNGRLVRESLGAWTAGRQNIRVDYVYGYQPVPYEVRRAAMWIARNNLTGSNVPRNALSQVDELGTFRLAVPGERGSWFGVPEVDRVLRDYQARNRVPGVA